MTNEGWKNAWASIRDSAKEIANMAITDQESVPATELAVLADKQVKRWEKIIESDRSPSERSEGE